MSDKSNGGPAFPRPAVFTAALGLASVEQDGMTLRDYFAAKSPITLEEAMKAAGMGNDLTYCLQSINCGNNGELLRKHARLAYQWADAMLKEREK